MTKAAGYFCRVSSATPVIGSAFGMAGVALASIAAGQASIQCHRYYRHDLPFESVSVAERTVQCILMFWARLGHQNLTSLAVTESWEDVLDVLQGPALQLRVEGS